MGEENEVNTGRKILLKESLTTMLSQFRVPNYGSITLIIHDGKIVQIERKEICHISSGVD